MFSSYVFYVRNMLKKGKTKLVNHSIGCSEKLFKVSKVFRNRIWNQTYMFFHAYMVRRAKIKPIHYI